MADNGLTLGSTRTPPALSSALSQHLAISASLSASVQAWPSDRFPEALTIASSWPSGG